MDNSNNNNKEFATLAEELASLKKQNEILNNQLNWYKSFFDNSADAVFIVQPNTWCILEANDIASNMLGIPKNELVGSTIPQFRRIFKLLSKTSAPVVLSELSFETEQNPDLMLEISARFVDFQGQKLIQAMARDVSEHYAMTDKLVQADKLVLLGQLSAGVSHEIRNPLAAVNLNLQLLSRKIPEDSAEYPFVQTALQGVERISKIVEVSLNFSRPAIPDVKEMNINSIIPQTLDLVASSIRKKDIKVNIKLAEDLPNVAIDAKQVQQVLINLITNASDAIKDKGNIDINTYLENSAKYNRGEYVVVAISDTGCGISPEELSKVFNPFFTRKAEGTGLGLPITQRILHQHNGIIDVQSKVNEGTTFYVKFPVPRDLS